MDANKLCAQIDEAVVSMRNLDAALANLDTVISGYERDASSAFIAWSMLVFGAGVLFGWLVI